MTADPTDFPTWADYRPGDPDVCVWCHVGGCSLRALIVRESA